jgi:hypothetical protein
MTEAACRPSLALESPEPRRVVADPAREQLERHDVLQQRVARSIDRSHSAAAEQRFDIVEPVDDGTDERIWIILERFAIGIAEALGSLVGGSAARTYHASPVDHRLAFGARQKRLGVLVRG